MKSIRDLFPLASSATVAANPQLLAPNGGSGNKNAVQVNVPRKRGGYATSMSGEPYWSEGKPKWNKTEAEFGLMLEAQKQAGEILRYEYEGITLRWADMRYTPDFVVFQLMYETDHEAPIQTIRLIEVKGDHIWDRDIVRYKGARAYWPEFAFEMWQLKKGQGWKRKY